MRKRIFALGFGVLFSVTPALSFADTFTPAQIQVQHLTAIAAALEAQASALSGGQSLACAALASKSTVAVNESFALAWGSVGAVAPNASSTVPMWTQNGVSEILIGQPGTWKYSFTFYSANGATATCATTIKVTPQ